MADERAGVRRNRIMAASVELDEYGVRMDHPWVRGVTRAREAHHYAVNVVYTYRIQTPSTYRIQTPSLSLVSE